MKVSGLVVCGGLVLASFVGSSRAAQVASDNATDSVYNDGWQTNDNGGSGFGNWALYGNGGGFFIGASTGNDLYGGGGSGNVNTGGKAFGIYSGGGSADAFRPFNGALTVGQSFNLAVDNGGVDDGKSVGFYLRDDSGSARFEFSFLGGPGGGYRVNAATQQNLTTGFTTQGMQTTFTLTGTNSYSFSVAFNGQSTETFTGTLGGTAGNGISQFLAFNRNNGGGGYRDFFINSPSITNPVPEPASLALIGGVIGLVGLRRRR